MNCIKCGRRLADGDLFCSGCGTKVEIQAPTGGFEKSTEAAGESQESFHVNDISWDLDGYPDADKNKKRDVALNWSSVMDHRDRKQFETLVDRRTLGGQDTSSGRRGFEEGSIFDRREEVRVAPRPRNSDFTEEDLIRELGSKEPPKETPGSTFRMEKERQRQERKKTIQESAEGFNYGDIFKNSRGMDTSSDIKSQGTGSNTFVLEKVDISDAIQEIPQNQEVFEPEFKKNTMQSMEIPREEFPDDFDQNDYFDYEKDDDDYRDYEKRRKSFGSKFVAGVAGVFGKLEKFARFDRDDDYEEGDGFRSEAETPRQDRDLKMSYKEIFEPNEEEAVSIKTQRTETARDAAFVGAGSRATRALDDWQSDIEAARREAKKNTASEPSEAPQGKDRFYTFNQKSAEFQALLDEEYERLRQRIQAESDEPSYLSSMPKPSPKADEFRAVVNKSGKSSEDSIKEEEPAPAEAEAIAEAAEEIPAEEPDVEPAEIPAEAAEEVSPEAETGAEPEIEEIAEPDAEPEAEEVIEPAAEPDPEDEPAAEPEVEEAIEPEVEPEVEEVAEAEVPAEPEIEEVAEPEVAEEPKPQDIAEFDRNITEPEPEAEVPEEGEPVEPETVLAAAETVEEPEAVAEPAVEAEPEAEPVEEEIPEPVQFTGVQFENNPDPEDPELSEFERRISELEYQVEEIVEPTPEPIQEEIKAPSFESGRNREKSSEDLNKTRVFKTEEVKEALHAGPDVENEFQKPLRYGDIFGSRASIEYEQKKKKGKSKLILLDILIAVLALAVLLTAIMVFGKNTGIGQKLSSLFTKEQTTEETTETTTETTPEVTPTPEISPMANAIIKQAVRNTNIGEIAEDTALRFTEGKDYGMEGLANAVTFTDADWYTTGSGETVTYMPELVGHVIEYHSKLVDRYNNDSDEVLDLIDPYSNYYYDVQSIVSEEGVTRKLSKLQIGEIRQDNAEFYMLIRLMYEISNETDPQILTRVVRLDTSENRVYVEDIETVTDLESSETATSEESTEEATTEEATEETYTEESYTEEGSTEEAYTEETYDESYSEETTEETYTEG